MLVYDGRYYLIGEGHKEFVGEKSQDNGFYFTTQANACVAHRTMR